MTQKMDIDSQIAKVVPVFRDKRSADKNFKIMEILALEGPMTKYDLTKKYHGLDSVVSNAERSKYSTIKRRVDDLVYQKYAKVFDTVEAKTGGEKEIIGLTEKGRFIIEAISLKVQNNWKKLYENYKEDIRKLNKPRWGKHNEYDLFIYWDSKYGLPLVFYKSLIDLRRKFLVSGFCDLDVIGEFIPTSMSEFITKWASRERDIISQDKQTQWLSAFSKKDLKSIEEAKKDPLIQDFLIKWRKEAKKMSSLFLFSNSEE